ncbi:hypothetical protein KC19_6G050800 [Ceratodon purpureus]|uniref:Uncharacterized protein n=1 Tax=Ceratodon purpureus TaxID=3225 RepID=A0A8T0HAM6_CERPU|nr:hypothetical protein KC19_6G050800 [Ceratodon purpureus]
MEKLELSITHLVFLLLQAESLLMCLGLWNEDSSMDNPNGPGCAVSIEATSFLIPC